MLCLTLRGGSGGWFIFDRPCAAHTMGRAQGCILLLLFLSSRLSQRTLGSMALRPVCVAMDPSVRWGDGRDGHSVPSTRIRAQA